MGSPCTLLGRKPESFRDAAMPRSADENLRGADLGEYPAPPVVSSGEFPLEPHNVAQCLDVLGKGLS